MLGAQRGALDIDGTCCGALPAVLPPEVRSAHSICRAACGVKWYSAVREGKFRVEAEELLYILRRQKPVNCKIWSIAALEKAYQSSVQRRGLWTKCQLTLRLFLSLFPRTFEIFGARREFVRPYRNSCTSVADSENEVMTHLAMTPQVGPGEMRTPAEHPPRGLLDECQKIHEVCAKAWYIPASLSASRASSRRTSVAHSLATTRPASATSSRPSRPASAQTRHSSGITMYRGRVSSRGTFTVQQLLE
eukprot:TRINITY_DN62524_c0_g1_i1.p1 TRINITY_DN62524_c0_g1~~TRINITY_DN62524_c0_g1_i1.p1  ORF type:complete len:248 (-),score=19.53 TRINITY_DN62524_c0_g1_i1:264-1007(-)